jgi:nucleotide-binding universal stress UspA family protein
MRAWVFAAEISNPEWAHALRLLEEVIARGLGGPSENIMKILIATDGSESSEAAIKEYKRLFPNPAGVEIKVVSAFEEPYALMGETYGGLSPEVIQEISDSSQKLRGKYCESATALIDGRAGGSNLSSEVLVGPAEKMILDAAAKWKPDLIVVGSHSRGFWGRMLGSVSDAVVHDADRCVLIAKPPSRR